MRTHRSNLGLYLLGCLCALVAPSCERAEDVAPIAWKSGYDDGFIAGREDRVSLDAGRVEGQEAGIREAHRIAKSGSAARFYVMPFFASLVAAFLSAAALQYMILLYCRLFRKLPPFWLTATVPHFASSESFDFMVHSTNIVKKHKLIREEHKRHHELRLKEIGTLRRLIEQSLRDLDRFQGANTDLLIAQFRQRIAEFEKEADRLEETETQR